MTKDLGYYASDRDGFFDGLVEQYGSTLQGIHIDDKFVMLSSIFAFHLIGEGGTMQDAWECFDPDSDSDRAVFDILNGLESLNADTQFGFAEALLAQVRETYRQQQSFYKQLAKAGVEDPLAAEVAVILASGGERTQSQCELVSQAWEQVFKTDKRLAARMDQAMGVEG
jgi:hypothetical protein